jgi:glycosyltransferase involved in cell wall biosynthesis
VSRPRVTIETPSYNQAAFLEETLCSVLDQAYPELEYIVIDGGSTDGSQEIVRRYADRLAYHEVQENRGQVAALNTGFRRATGALLGWLNSDDVLLPGAIERVVEEFEHDPELAFVYGDNVFIDEASAELGPLEARPFDRAAMVRACANHVPQPGSLFRRSALEAVPLNEAGYYFFDFEFVLRLGEHARVKRIAVPLAGYRLHAQSKSIGAPISKAGDYLRLADTFFSAPDFPPSLRPHARAGRARAYLDAGEYFYDGLDVRSARRYLAKGLLLRPGLASRRSLSLLLKSLLPPSLVARGKARRARARSAPT